MLWLGTSPHQAEVRAMLNKHQIGLMSQPASHSPEPGWIWAADNGCFSDAWKPERWMRWLERPHPRSGCLFAVVPDRVGSHSDTVARWKGWADTVAALRYPLAFVAQNMWESKSTPWDELDCLFIGGDTDWKMSMNAFKAAREARERGKWVHVGRVNSLKRLREWSQYADSSDGTFLAFGPEKNSRRVAEWVTQLHADNQERIDWALT